MDEIANMRGVSGLILAVVIAASARGHDIITTNLLYTRDISRIFAKRCVACHAQGSSLPLTTYQEVRPWAVDIKEQVLSRDMPRWGAVKGFGDLQPDGALTQEEIIIIASWVIGGAPNGDPLLLPKAPPRLSQGSGFRYAREMVVKTPVVLGSGIQLRGLRPMGQGIVASNRVTAVFPDGRVEPLVWLYQYDLQWGTKFRLREPLALPKGTRIEATSGVEMGLEGH